MPHTMIGTPLPSASSDFFHRPSRRLPILFGWIRASAEFLGVCIFELLSLIEMDVGLVLVVVRNSSRDD